MGRSLPIGIIGRGAKLRRAPVSAAADPEPPVAGWVERLNATNSAQFSLDTGNEVDSWTGLGAWTALALARPIYTENVRNGRGAVVFDGVQQYLGNSSPPLSGSTASHVFVACKVTAAAGAQSGPVISSPTGALTSHYSFSDDKIYSGFGIAARYSANQNPAGVIRNWHVLEHYLTASGSWSLRIDGTSQMTQISQTVSYGGTMYLARWGSSYCKVEVGEVIIYDSVLSGDDVTNTRDFLTDRWVTPA